MRDSFVMFCTSKRPPIGAIGIVQQGGGNTPTCLAFRIFWLVQSECDLSCLYVFVKLTCYSHIIYISFIMFYQLYHVIREHLCNLCTWTSLPFDDCQASLALKFLAGCQGMLRWSVTHDLTSTFNR